MWGHSHSKPSLATILPMASTFKEWLRYNQYAVSIWPSHTQRRKISSRCRARNYQQRLSHRHREILTAEVSLWRHQLLNGIYQHRHASQATRYTTINQVIKNAILIPDIKTTNVMTSTSLPSTDQNIWSNIFWWSIYATKVVNAKIPTIFLHFLHHQHHDEVLAGSDLKKVTHCTDGAR